MKRKFNIEVMYFKNSGKLYIDEKFTAEYTNCGSEEHPMCYMSEVVDDIKDRNNRSTLPGLASGFWNSYIVVNCDEGFPVLIVPERLRGVG